MTLSVLILASYFAIGCEIMPKPVQAAPSVESKKMDMDSRLSDLASQIAKSMTEQRKSKIAVIEFTDLRGNVTDFGRFLAEKLITKLFATGKFQVMERAKLKKALEEQQFGLTGMVDDETAARLGKILGVEAIVIGTVTDLGSTVDVNSRLIGTETGTVFAVASTPFEKDEAVAKLMREGVGVEKEDATTRSAPAMLTTPSISQGQRSVSKTEMNDFIFEAKGCKRSGQKTSCVIAVTNNAQKESALTITGTWNVGTFLYDDTGNQYKPTGLRFGAGTNNGYDSQSLPPSLPVITILTFEDVSPQAQLVSLRLYCNSKDNNGNPKDFFPVLRDIPLSK